MGFVVWYCAGNSIRGVSGGSPILLDGDYFLMVLRGNVAPLIQNLFLKYLVYVPEKGFPVWLILRYVWSTYIFLG